jgi:sigma-B regulation protein RsbU (phosphoserine phosphatase)
VLYTDGITEVHSPDDEEYGTERLQRFLRRHASEPLTQLADLLFAEIDAFAGGNPPLDDQTLLLVRRS